MFYVNGMHIIITRIRTSKRLLCLKNLASIFSFLFSITLFFIYTHSCVRSFWMRKEIGVSFLSSSACCSLIYHQQLLFYIDNCFLFSSLNFFFPYLKISISFSFRFPSPSFFILYFLRISIGYISL